MAEPIAIQTSPIRLATLLVASMVFGGMVITRAREREDWLLYGFAAFFLILCAAGLWTLLFRRATLTIDASGVRFAQGHTQWALAWDEIASMHFFDTRVNGMRTNRRLVLVDRQGRERSIPSALTVTPDQLAVLIGERLPRRS